MKKVYTATFVLSFLLLLACSKDFLKPYEVRILGTWKITGVNRVGLGGNTDNLPFTDGTFSFHEDGSLTYVNNAGAIFGGSWVIEKKWRDDEKLQSLQITAIDFSTQKVLAEYYDDMNFTGTNHFNANISSGLHVYVTHFGR